MDVTVNVLELACGVAVAEIGRPAPQHVVQVGDHDRPWCASEAAVGSVTDLGPYRCHRPFRRPALQIPMTGPSERLHLVVVVSQEVEAVGSSGQAGDPGLVRVQSKPERGQDVAYPP